MTRHAGIAIRGQLKPHMERHYLRLFALKERASKEERIALKTDAVRLLKDWFVGRIFELKKSTRRMNVSKLQAPSPQE